MIDFYRRIAPKLKTTIVFNGDVDPCVSYEGTRNAIEKVGTDTHTHAIRHTPHTHTHTERERERETQKHKLCDCVRIERERPRRGSRERGEDREGRRRGRSRSERERLESITVSPLHLFMRQRGRTGRPWMHAQTNHWSLGLDNLTHRPSVRLAVGGLTQVGFPVLPGGAYRPWFFNKSATTVEVLSAKTSLFGPNLELRDAGPQVGR